MKKHCFIPGLVFFLLFSVAMSSAEDTPSVGEKLVRELWKNIAAGDWTAVQKGLAPEFQSVHEDITRNAAEELELLKNLQLGNFELSDFNTTQKGSTLIVTYRAMTEEVITGMDLPARAAMRMSIFTKTPDGWKWVAHANLNSLVPFMSQTPEEPEEPAPAAPTKPSEKPSPKIHPRT
ncbi:MAG TPA: nuclear transport factor 2 family protein [Candidatus Omnitrophota bacterium]|nr:nuclear transport factor 2 family protein [Candidatus Omnitrophota bacterium]HPS36307.1 nuclear transport factor 2 family protein [Candidatus Omnitrophota bacterium]